MPFGRSGGGGDPPCGATRTQSLPARWRPSLRGRCTTRRRVAPRPGSARRGGGRCQGGHRLGRSGHSRRPADRATGGARFRLSGRPLRRCRPGRLPSSRRLRLERRRMGRGLCQRGGGRNGHRRGRNRRRHRRQCLCRPAVGGARPWRGIFRRGDTLQAGAASIAAGGVFVALRVPYRKRPGAGAMDRRGDCSHPARNRDRLLPDAPLGDRRAGDCAARHRLRRRRGAGARSSRRVRFAAA